MIELIIFRTTFQTIIFAIQKQTCSSVTSYCATFAIIPAAMKAVLKLYIQSCIHWRTRSNYQFAANVSRTPAGTAERVTMWAKDMNARAQEVIKETIVKVEMAGTWSVTASNTNIGYNKYKMQC